MSIIVDCDANPKIPSGLYLTGEGTEHRKMGKITLEKREDGKLYANGKEVVRHLSSKQENGKSIQGHKLRKELKDMQVLNACIMDALLANPQLIPDEWKSGYTYFWGTAFRDVDGCLYVEGLYWRGGQWDWRYGGLGSDWRLQRPGRGARKLDLGIWGSYRFLILCPLALRIFSAPRTNFGSCAGFFI